jgi:RimJ/RimL family protein N-acetyltransferase
MTPPEFYPATAIVPGEKRTDRVLLRPLRATDVELDYDAVMSSAAQLRTWSQGNWPADDFTLGENLADLQRHEREHDERVAFTFTVLDPGATRCLGCVYIMPLWPRIAGLCAGAAYAADVGFWVRTSEIDTELDRHLLATLRDWLSSEWAFDCVVYAVSPGEARQGLILSEAGLERRGSFALADGRSCLVFS